jgi:hypothetical protein
VEHHGFSGNAFHVVLLRMVDLGHLEVASRVQTSEMGTYAYLFRQTSPPVPSGDESNGSHYT